MPEQSPVFFLSKSGSRLSSILAATLLAAVVWLGSGCGKDDPPPPTTPSGGGITVSPGSPVVLVGDTVRFTATVSGVGGGVTWSKLPANPSTPDTAGSLSADGLFTAPTHVGGVFDYQYVIRATSVVDPNLFGQAMVTVPRIIVSASPSDIASVLPSTLVPYQIDVMNSPNTDFRLFVDGIEGGNSSVGTFTKTGTNTAIYQAPSFRDTTRIFGLLVKSVFDSTRLAFPTVTVRRGETVDADPALNQFAPEWNPGVRAIAYVEGSPWKLILHALPANTRSELASLDWPGATYEGRVSWGLDALNIAFSEDAGGRKVIGLASLASFPAVVRSVFDPDGVSNYFEAVYDPSPGASAESLIVITDVSGSHQIKMYPASSAATEPGRVLYTAAPGVTIRNHDARWIQGELAISAVLSSSGMDQAIWFEDDGSGSPAVTVISDGMGQRTRSHWTLQNGLPRITFLWDVNQTAYRVPRNVTSAPIRLYSEFFPEHSADLSEATVDEHVISRLSPDGRYHLWIVEFPPRDFLGVSRAEELELAAMGIFGPLRPQEWGRWLGTEQWVLTGDRDR